MNILKPVLVILLIGSVHVASGQLITKKESAAINHILKEVSQQYQPQNYLIRNTTLLTMVDPILRENQDVRIGNGAILEVGHLSPGSGEIIIDGTGKYLMPGLVDMHIHLFDQHQMKSTWMLLLTINGVTSVRDMCGELNKLALREQINENKVLAPTLYQAGPIVDGVPDRFGLFAVATTPAEGRQVVKEQKAAGYDFIKVYNSLKQEVYDAIVDEAAKCDLPVFGHVPDAVNVSGAMNQQQSIEHLTGYQEWKDQKEIYVNADANYPAVTAESEAWICPTLYNHTLAISREKASDAFYKAETAKFLPNKLKKRWEKPLKKHKRKHAGFDSLSTQNLETIMEITKNLYSANARLIAGTDAGGLHYLIPGFALHEELRLMGELGISNYEVLEMVTCNAAKAMNRETEFGTIAPGKRADFLLLNKNPLEDLANLKDRHGIMLRGIWLSAVEIERISDRIKETFEN